MNRYSWGLLPRLGSKIEHHRKKEAHRDLDVLLGTTWEQSAADHSLWKLRCSQIASACVRAALRGGASSDVAMGEHMQFLRRLCALANRARIQALMHRYLDMLLARVRPAQSTNMERAVAQVHKELREIQGASRSLSAYAQILGVSPGHLSRCFLAIVGQTYRTKRRHIRMQAACRMLRRSQLKISAIALQLGVADPSQFVADFRREFGVTPGQDRRQHYHARPDSWARELSS